MKLSLVLPENLSKMAKVAVSETCCTDCNIVWHRVGLLEFTQKSYSIVVGIFCKNVSRNRSYDWLAYNETC